MLKTKELRRLLLIHLEAEDSHASTGRHKNSSKVKRNVNLPPDIINKDNKNRILKSNFDGDLSQNLSLSEVNHSSQSQVVTNQHRCRAATLSINPEKSQKRKKREWPTPYISPKNKHESQICKKSSGRICSIRISAKEGLSFEILEKVQKDEI